MPAYSLILELQLELNHLEEYINECEELITEINHRRSLCVRGSQRDVYLWNVYNMVDDLIDDLNQQWQDITDEIRRLQNA